MVGQSDSSKLFLSSSIGCFLLPKLRKYDDDARQAPKLLGKQVVEEKTLSLKQNIRQSQNSL